MVDVSRFVEEVVLKPLAFKVVAAFNDDFFAAFGVEVLLGTVLVDYVEFVESVVPGGAERVDGRIGDRVDRVEWHLEVF